MRHSSFVRGIITGMVGGLAGTISMYLFQIGIFTILGWPVNTSFSIIGNSAVAFLSKMGITLAGGASLGGRIYCVIGLTLGTMLGVAVTNLEPLRQTSLKKRVELSILYVEAMSLPLLTLGTLALKMSTVDAILWFGISSIMHLVYGLVLGMVTSYGVGRRVQDSQTQSTEICIKHTNTTSITTPNATFR